MAEEDEFEKSRYPKGITVNDLTGINIKPHLIEREELHLILIQKISILNTITCK